MDFHSMKRKELQALCKKHGLPANKTNLEMAHNLASLLTKPDVESIKEKAEVEQSKEKDGSVENDFKDASRKSKRVRFCLEEEQSQGEVVRQIEEKTRVQLKSAMKPGFEKCSNPIKGMELRMTRSRKLAEVVSSPLGSKKLRKGANTGNRDGEKKETRRKPSTDAPVNTSSDNADKKDADEIALVSPVERRMTRQRKAKQTEVVAEVLKSTSKSEGGPRRTRRNTLIIDNSIALEEKRDSLLKEKLAIPEAEIQEGNDESERPPLFEKASKRSKTKSRSYKKPGQSDGQLGTDDVAGKIASLEVEGELKNAPKSEQVTRRSKRTAPRVKEFNKSDELSGSTGNQIPLQCITNIVEPPRTSHNRTSKRKSLAVIGEEPPSNTNIAEPPRTCHNRTSKRKSLAVIGEEPPSNTNIVEPPRTSHNRTSKRKPLAVVGEEPPSVTNIVELPSTSHNRTLKQKSVAVINEELPTITNIDDPPKTSQSRTSKRKSVAVIDGVLKHKKDRRKRMQQEQPAKPDSSVSVVMNSELVDSFNVILPSTGVEKKTSPEKDVIECQKIDSNETQGSLIPKLRSKKSSGKGRHRKTLSKLPNKKISSQKEVGVSTKDLTDNYKSGVGCINEVLEEVNDEVVPAAEVESVEIYVDQSLEVKAIPESTIPLVDTSLKVQCSDTVKESSLIDELVKPCIEPKNIAKNLVEVEQTNSKETELLNDNTELLVGTCAKSEEIVEVTPINGSSEIQTEVSECNEESSAGNAEYDHPLSSTDAILLAPSECNLCISTTDMKDGSVTSTKSGCSSRKLKEAVEEKVLGNRLEYSGEDPSMEKSKQAVIENQKQKEQVEGVMHLSSELDFNESSIAQSQEGLKEKSEEMRHEGSACNLENFNMTRSCEDEKNEPEMRHEGSGCNLESFNVMGSCEDEKNNAEVSLLEELGMKDDQETFSVEEPLISPRGSVSTEDYLNFRNISTKTISSPEFQVDSEGRNGVERTGIENVVELLAEIAVHETNYKCLDGGNAAEDPRLGTPSQGCIKEILEDVTDEAVPATEVKSVELYMDQRLEVIAIPESTIPLVDTSLKEQCTDAAKENSHNDELEKSCVDTKNIAMKLVEVEQTNSKETRRLNDNVEFLVGTCAKSEEIVEATPINGSSEIQIEVSDCKEETSAGNAEYDGPLSSTDAILLAPSECTPCYSTTDMKDGSVTSTKSGCSSRKFKAVEENKVLGNKLEYSGEAPSMENQKEHVEVVINLSAELDLNESLIVQSQEGLKEKSEEMRHEGSGGNLENFNVISSCEDEKNEAEMRHEGSVGNLENFNVTGSCENEKNDAEVSLLEEHGMKEDQETFSVEERLITPRGSVTTEDYLNFSNISTKTISSPVSQVDSEGDNDVERKGIEKIVELPAEIAVHEATYECMNGENVAEDQSIGTPQGVGCIKEIVEDVTDEVVPGTEAKSVELYMDQGLEVNAFPESAIPLVDTSLKEQCTDTAMESSHIDELVKPCVKPKNIDIKLVEVEQTNSKETERLNDIAEFLVGTCAKSEEIVETAPINGSSKIQIEVSECNEEPFAGNAEYDHPLSSTDAILLSPSECTPYYSTTDMKDASVTSAKSGCSTRKFKEAVEENKVLGDRLEYSGEAPSMEKSKQAVIENQKEHVEGVMHLPSELDLSESLIAQSQEGLKEKSEEMRHKGSAGNLENFNVMSSCEDEKHEAEMRHEGSVGNLDNFSVMDSCEDEKNYAEVPLLEESDMKDDQETSSVKFEEPLISPRGSVTTEDYLNLSNSSTKTTSSHVSQFDSEGDNDVERIGVEKIVEPPAEIAVDEANHDCTDGGNVAEDQCIGTLSEAYSQVAVNIEKSVRIKEEVHEALAELTVFKSNHDCDDKINMVYDEAGGTPHISRADVPSTVNVEFNVETTEANKTSQSTIFEPNYGYNEYDCGNVVEDENIGSSQISQEAVIPCIVNAEDVARNEEKADRLLEEMTISEISYGYKDGGIVEEAENKGISSMSHVDKILDFSEEIVALETNHDSTVGRNVADDENIWVSSISQDSQELNARGEEKTTMIHTAEFENTVGEVKDAKCLQQAEDNGLSVEFLQQNTEDLLNLIQAVSETDDKTADVPDENVIETDGSLGDEDSNIGMSSTSSEFENIVGEVENTKCLQQAEDDNGLSEEFLQQNTVDLLNLIQSVSETNDKIVDVPVENVVKTDLSLGDEDNSIGMSPTSRDTFERQDDDDLLQAPEELLNRKNDELDSHSNSDKDTINAKFVEKLEEFISNSSGTSPFLEDSKDTSTDDCLMTKEEAEAEAEAEAEFHFGPDSMVEQLGINSDDENVKNTEVHQVICSKPPENILSDKENTDNFDGDNCDSTAFGFIVENEMKLLSEFSSGNTGDVQPKEDDLEAIGSYVTSEEDRMEAKGSLFDSEEPTEEPDTLSGDSRLLCGRVHVNIERPFVVNTEQALLMHTNEEVDNNDVSVQDYAIQESFEVQQQGNSENHNYDTNVEALEDVTENDLSSHWSDIQHDSAIITEGKELEDAANSLGDIFSFEEEDCCSVVVALQAHSVVNSVVSEERCEVNDVTFEHTCKEDVSEEENASFSEERCEVNDVDFEPVNASMIQGDEETNCGTDTYELNAWEIRLFSEDNAGNEAAAIVENRTSGETFEAMATREPVPEERVGTYHINSSDESQPGAVSIREESKNKEHSTTVTDEEENSEASLSLLFAMEETEVHETMLQSTPKKAVERNIMDEIHSMLTKMHISSTVRAKRSRAFTIQMSPKAKRPSGLSTVGMKENAQQLSNVKGERSVTKRRVFEDLQNIRNR